jgi:hypothetical protein
MASSAEDLFLEAWNEFGFPGSDITSEYRFFLDRRWRFDFAFPSRKVAIEIDGRGRHQTVTGVRSDCEKYNTAILCGWAVLRIPTSDLKGKDEWGEPLIEKFIELLCKVLAQREIHVTTDNSPTEMGDMLPLRFAQARKAPRNLSGKHPR